MRLLVRETRLGFRSRAGGTAWVAVAIGGNGEAVMAHELGGRHGHEGGKAGEVRICLSRGG